MTHKHNHAEENDTIFDKLAQAAHWTVPDCDQEEYVEMEIELTVEDEVPGIGDS